MPHLSAGDMTAFVDRAGAALNDRFHVLEPGIFGKGVRQRPGSPAWFMAASHAGSEQTRNMSRAALVAEEATKYIVQAYGLDEAQVNYGLPAADVRDTALGAACPLEADLPCQPRKYRAYSGRCNNVQSPHWGAAGTRYVRLLPAEYGDGVGLPRGAAAPPPAGGLPSARAVSLAVHGARDLPHAHLAAAAAVWAELVAHDVALTPQMTGMDGSRLKCWRVLAGTDGSRLKCCGVCMDGSRLKCWRVLAGMDGSRLKCWRVLAGMDGSRLKCWRVLAGMDGSRLKCWRVLAGTDGSRLKCWRVLAGTDGSRLKCWRVLAGMDGSRLKCWRVLAGMDGSRLKCWRVLAGMDGSRLKCWRVLAGMDGSRLKCWRVLAGMDGSRLKCWRVLAGMDGSRLKCWRVLAGMDGSRLKCWRVLAGMDGSRLKCWRVLAGMDGSRLKCWRVLAGMDGSRLKCWRMDGSRLKCWRVLAGMDGSRLKCWRVLAGMDGSRLKCCGVCMDGSRLKCWRVLAGMDGSRLKCWRVLAGMDGSRLKCWRVLAGMDGSRLKCWRVLAGMDGSRLKCWRVLAGMDGSRLKCWRVLAGMDGSRLKCWRMDGSRLKCCGVDFKDFHPECFPIRIADSDPVFGRAGETCQEYARSATAPRIGCTLGPREQLNKVTSYLDASMIYGSSQEDANKLRTFSGGQLAFQVGPGGTTLLPQDSNNLDCRLNGTYKCFSAGDHRANEHVGLAALHTLWLREHNRLALELKTRNPHWDDETLFQEARRIVAAEIQHITYSEFLPAVLGQMTMDQYGLRPQASGFFTGYDIDANPGVANSVAAAALWFVASLMPKTLFSFDRAGRKVGERSLAASFYAPAQLYKADGVGAALRSLMHGPAQREDEHINEVMTNHMFQEPGKGAGLDLAAQVIQQGRDHGLPGYMRWREFCGLPVAASFQQLPDILPADVSARLQRVYRNVSDVDLFTGALAERAAPGSAVGPTLACLLGRQFRQLRRGDRHWYENDLPPSSFSKEQLNELRKVTLARVICDNVDHMDEVQPNIFLEKDPFLNAMAPCAGPVVPRLDLAPWSTAGQRLAVPPALLAESVARAGRDLGDVMRRELDLWRQQRGADPLSPVGTAYGFNRPKRQAAQIANTSFLLQFASQRFVDSFLQSQLQDLEVGRSAKASLHELVALLPRVDLADTLDIPRVFRCDEQALPCDHTSRYRTATGWCNNLRRPEQGKSLRAFVRLLPPQYQDGVGSPRAVSVTGGPLPSPRLVSVSVHPDTSRPHLRYSLMFMQLGQLLDHDLTHTPVNRAFVGEAILDCQPCDASRAVHPECFPIPIPEGDPYFPHVNISTGRPLCIPVTRSMPGQLTLGYREQMNQVTAYLDASFVYGSDVCETNALRTFSAGKMNVTRRPSGGKPLLPTTTTHPECKSSSKVCFRAGDARASEQPGLAALHTLFLREHNRLAEGLAGLNPHWSDETLYQTARRILSAAWQHVVYAEFLPRLFGWDGLHRHELTLRPEGYFDGYDADCDATIVNEFAAAAFRFGHSLLRPSLPRADESYSPRQPPVRLRDTFFNPEPLRRNGMLDELLRGLVAAPMESLDQFITSEVTNHLFESRAPYSGMDLAAINIQRGRDHGLAGYTAYRRLCNLTRALDFDGLKGEVPSPAAERLRRLYAHVDDVDLFPGGLAETPLPGGVVGPTFACVIGHQFRLLRRCDRYWYENSDPLVRFTEAQLADIRKATLARLVCDNTDRVGAIQRSALDLADPFLNPRVPCSAIPGLDLSLWKERRSCVVGLTSIEVGAAERTSPCVMCTCTTEGPICQSLKISNCFALAKSFSHAAILGDHVCKVQCAFVFRALPKVMDQIDNQLGFS
ncbi:uncharacterized protein LOC134531301 [Bacillus rossius redtenbacheri]|uniref:uncharacterized protein LOC134531301 n=1 Tax=Bacillus rossius redtenbacheri TaxID=93214 RepID=UPI002FDD15D0